MTRSRSGGFQEFMGGSATRFDVPAGTPPVAPGEVGEAPPIDVMVGPRGEMPASFARIVRRVLTIDVEDVYDRVTQGLREGKLPAHRAEYGDLVDELDRASDLHLQTHQLAAAAAVTVGRYEADLEVLRSDMRSQAVAALNQERDAMGGKKDAPKPKQITDADVESRMAGAYPAEYRRLETLLAEAKAVQKFIAALPEQWASRRRELDGRVRTVRTG